MAKLFVMDYSGHTTFDFDHADPAQIENANQKLLKCLADGGTIATRRAGETGYRQVKDPAQIQDETLLVPQLKGG